MSLSWPEKKLISVRGTLVERQIFGRFSFPSFHDRFCRPVSMTTWPKRYVGANDAGREGGEETEQRRRDEVCTGPDERPANICIARRGFAENQCAADRMDVFEKNISVQGAYKVIQKRPSLAIRIE